MIREFQKSDIKRIMELWLAGNEDAHPFIGKEYWRSHFAEVQEQILQAEVFVYEKEGTVQGFIGMVDDYIAGIFVDKACRSCGIGREILNYAKERHDELTLSVYQKNVRAAAFYLREKFSVLSEAVDEDTGEIDYTMIWKKEK